MEGKASLTCARHDVFFVRGVAGVERKLKNGGRMNWGGDRVSDCWEEGRDFCGTSTARGGSFEGRDVDEICYLLAA